MKSQLRYHQMLVSPRLGGAEKLAIEIQRFIEAQRPGTGELLVPAGGESQRQVLGEHLHSRPYAFERLLSRRRIPSLLANLELAGTLRRATPGLLHVHSPFVYGALRPFLAVTGLRTILHLHLDYTEEQLQWPLQRAPDVVIVCAKFMHQRVANVLAARPPVKTAIVPVINAVDTARFVPGDRSRAKQELGIGAERPVYLMAANLAPHKGQETSIRAVAHLVERGMRPLLWLVGEEREAQGTYSVQLRELVAGLGLSGCVEFLGYRNDVPRLLHAADCLLLPSTSEGLPLSILEAQASKVAVLAAPTAGIPEVIEHGQTGFLIAAGDAEGYADVLVRLSADPQSARAVEEEAYRQVVANYTLDRYCARILAQYDQLLDDSGARAQGEPTAGTDRPATRAPRGA